MIPLAVHAHHPSADYTGLGLAALAGWVGVPGVGEAALIAAGVAAARGRLDLATVLVVAGAGGTIGGIVGWLIGLKGGRALITRPGPFRRARLGALRFGDRFYERVGPVAVFFTPAWVAGIHDMRAALYLPANAVSALVWALMFGGGAYLVGPSIADVSTDLGWVGTGLIGLLVLAAAVGALAGRRRHGNA